jgi:HD-like signal output (HDOD) protein
MEKQQQNHYKIAKIKNLPTLPEASCRIITAINNPDISIEELTRVISTSSALSGRLLGLANSAYFGWPGEIEDLRLAIIQVLGLNLVKGLAVSILVSNEFDVSRCSQFNCEQFWAHGLITATLAQKLAIQIHDEKVNPSTAYTAGLLLNIGLLAVVYAFPDELNQVFINVQKNDSSLSHEIVDALGESHFQMGYLLLKRWRLPAIFPMVLQQYGDLKCQGGDEVMKMTNLLKLCSQLAEDIYSNEDPKLVVSVNTINQLDLVPAKVQKTVGELFEKRDNIKDLAISLTGR